MARKKGPPKRQRKLSGGPRKPRKVKRKLSAYNRHVQREMKAGRSMKQAAASWKRGSSRVSRAKVGVKRRVARRRARRVIPARKSRKAPKKVGKKVGKGGFNQQKLFKLARMAAMLGPHAGVWMGAGTPAQKINTSVGLLSGVDMNTGQFDIQRLMAGYLPLLATGAITAVIPKINGLIRGLM